MMVRSLISGFETKASIKFSATPQTPNPPTRIEEPDLIPLSASDGPGTYLLKALTISCFWRWTIREKFIEQSYFERLLSIICFYFEKKKIFFF